MICSDGHIYFCGICDLPPPPPPKRCVSSLVFSICGFKVKTNWTLHLLLVFNVHVLPSSCMCLRVLIFSSKDECIPYFQLS